MATLAAADALYDGGTYHAAATAYQALLQRGEVPAAGVDEVAFRVCVALGRAEQWEAALEAALAFYQGHSGTAWEVRALAWMAELYRKLPHEVYFIKDGAGGSRVLRGHGEQGLGIPTNADGTVPHRIYSHPHDEWIGDAALEAARVRCSELGGNAGAEEIGLCFALAQVLGARVRRQWDLTPWQAEVDPPIDPDAAYDPCWPLPQKVLFLFERIRRLAASLPDSPLLTAASLLGEAVWLSAYQLHLLRVAADEDEEERAGRCLYQDRSPEERIEQALAECLDGPLREQALLTRALLRADRGRLVEAVTDLRELSRSAAEGAIRKHATAHLRTITCKELELETCGAELPGQSARVTLTYRNVERVHYTAYAFDLRGAYAADPVQYGPDHPTFPGTVLTLGEAERFYGRRVAQGWLDLPPSEPHCFRTERVPLPLQEPGAYAVEFRTAGVRTTGLVLVTDLALVHLRARAGALLFLADAESGAARGGEVMLRGFRSGYKPDQKPLQIGADGLLSLAEPEIKGWNRPEYTALAVSDGRVALSGKVEPPWNVTRGASSYQVHGVMDRPVYRPGQTAHYRLLLMQREGGWWKPVAGKRVTFQVTDPARTLVEETQLCTDEWGVVSGELILAPDAPLGMYHGRIIGFGRGGVEDCRFRVEEYRKPEFSVSVTSAAERVKPGAQVDLAVRAAYYWGAPVDGAAVTYRVYRERYYPASPFVMSWAPDDEYPMHPVGGSLVEEGEARTGDDGSAEVRFTTLPAEAGDPDALYRVEVEVRDASRRVISVATTVRASRRSLHLFARSPWSYVAPGLPVEVEVAIRNAEDQPVSTSALVRVYRQSRPSAGEAEPREERIYENPLETDAHGAAVIRWAAEQGGSYRVAFYAWDPEAEEEVGASTVIWVSGATGAEAVEGALALRAERPNYREGETAKILITAPREGCTVLLLQVVGHDVREHQLLSVPNGEREVELALGPADVPSIRLQAVCIRDGKAHEAECELFVRPAVEELRIAVSAERERYRPGETARLQVRARDAADRPVQAELSLAVADAALAYIQSDLTRPIHSAFTPARRDNSVRLTTSPALRLSGASKIQSTARADGAVSFSPPPALRSLPWWAGEEENVWYSLPMYYRFGSDDERGPYHYMMSKRLRRTGARSVPVGAAFEAPAAGGVAQVKKKKAESLTAANEMISEYGPADSEAPAEDEGGVRQQFADTAFWSATVRTDAAGEASVEFTWPDNLTEWRASTVGNTRAGEVGGGETRLRTAQEVVVRAQTPRFLVEGDQAVLSAVVHNYLEEPLRGTVWIQMEGDGLELCGGSAPREELSIRAGGEARIDWRVRARRPGPLRVRMGFQAEAGSDAAEARFPVLVRGARVTLTQAGELRDGSATHARDRITLRLPEDRQPGSARLVVRASPSLVGLALDALPYLVDYPYGCIEQTVSRFVPAVLTSQALQRLGVDLEGFTALREAGREAERALGARPLVEHTPYTYPELGKAEKPARLGPPVVTRSTLEGVVRRSLRRLSGSQNGDGGWGWWPGDSSTTEMTAYVVEGLLEAQAAGWTITPGWVDRGLRFVANRLKTDLETDEKAVRMDLHTLVRAASVLVQEPKHRETARKALLERAYGSRERLTDYGKALLALALQEAGNGAEAGQVLRNLLDRVRTDPHAGTAWWSGGGRSWHWYDNRPETGAAALRATLRILPSSPIMPMVVRWLAQNRRGLAWYSTRESALVIRALLEYAEARGELAADYALTLSAGQARAEFPVRGAEAALAPVVWEVPDGLLRTGEQELVLEKAGAGALYYSATLEYFSTEDQLPTTGHGLTIRRHYYRKRITSTPRLPHASRSNAFLEDEGEWPNPFLTGDLTLLDPPEEWWDQDEDEELPVRWERTPLQHSEPVHSGELLEVELTLEADNEIGYVLIEDIKPAGCEAEDRRSGRRWTGGLSVYQELRDQKVALFIERVPQGRTTVSYLLRAEAPGVFTALPAFGYAMYAPEFQSLSARRSLEVSDEAP